MKYQTMHQKPAVGVVFPCSGIEVYNDPWLCCCAEVRVSKLTVTGEAFGGGNQNSSRDHSTATYLSKRGFAWVEAREEKGIVLG